MKQQRAMGFSLVELVVVILLIGILSAVAVPRLFQSTYKAYDAAIQRFNAEFASALNVLRADWLLNGSQTTYNDSTVVWNMDGQYGNPTGVVEVAKDAEGCINIVTNLLGYPATMFSDVGAADEVSTTGNDWFVEFVQTGGTPEVKDATTGDVTQAAVPGDIPTCNYWYVKGSDDRMSYAGVQYVPSARMPLSLQVK